MNFVKRTSKRENTIENHALPPVHVQWKEENQYKNESLFSAWGEGEKEVPYIFFHNFTACPLSAGESRSEGETSDRQTSDIRNSVPESKRAPQAPIYIAPVGRHHHPLNLLNLLNPRASGVSNGARQHRHLERSRMPLWETDGKCSHDTLSREISHSNAARTIRGGDFSTPLRFGRNDGRARAGFSVIWGVRFLHSAPLRSK